MRRNLTLSITACFIFFISGTISGQDQQNGTYASYAPGFASAQSFYEGTNNLISDIVQSMFTHDEKDEKTGSTGIISIGYNRFFSEKIKLGISGSYMKYTNTRDFLEDGELKQHFKWSDSFITLMLRFDFHYLRKEKLSMYCGLSAGISFVEGKNISGAEDLALPSKSLFAFHLNAFGIRFGKDLGFFLESGFGYNGLVSGGIDYQF